MAKLDKIGPFVVKHLGSGRDPWQMLLECPCGKVFKADPESGENVVDAAGGRTWQPQCPECKLLGDGSKSG